MSEWYYARGGQQGGPVTLEQLRELARTGGLDPVKDLVWTSTMKDWTPAGQVEGLFMAASTPVAPPAAIPAAPSNPYAAPQSAWVEPVSSSDSALNEIIPGSEPINIGACVKRGFDLTVRNFGIILLVGLTYFGILFAVGAVLGLIDVSLGLGGSSKTVWQSQGGAATYTYQQHGSPLSQILTQVLGIFLAMGLVRIGLNLVSGKEISVGMLFGEGRKLLKAIGATILFGLMVGLGFVLLIVPGIYLAMRYGQYMTAIVDRDMGVMESLSYSSSITTNNRLNLFLLALVAFAIAIAGLLAFCVGLIFAYPVIWLTWVSAYRWMQYGHRAVMDHPGTLTPMLRGV